MFECIMYFHNITQTLLGPEPTPTLTHVHTTIASRSQRDLQLRFVDLKLQLKQWRSTNKSRYGTAQSLVIVKETPGDNILTQ